ncbi:MAG TPA: valine--tRNA ligase [Acidimicrobiales bacterium]|nr:valine--tRNA ligase [Acidimicrobiales bacterium]
MPQAVPEKPTLDGLEDRWAKRWEDDRIYAFDRTATRDQVYSIDTPPPTVSGSLHVGHVFSYTHTDTVARYRRMRGLKVFYPMGWDDNGLATERRVQNYYGVRCDPSLHYEASFEPPAEGGLPSGKDPVAVSRPNFVELCERLVAEDEKAFEALYRHLGLSVDWHQHYTTIGDRARRASQRGFLRLLARGEAYSAEAPTLWDVDFRTAVAQAELEDREKPGAYHQLAFHLADGQDLLIDTTRPELLVSCVAVVAHPDDARYSAMIGSPVRTPLFGVEVPFVTHPLAQPDKGTGVAMICTFGDVTDVIWWRELGLPVRAVVGRDGRLSAGAPSDLPPAAASLYESELAGRTVRQAQTRTVELLRDSGELVGEPRQITHPVKFYEKGERPLEIVTSRQWFYRTLTHRAELLERGRQLRWHPPYMESRYANWVEGLNTDWLISRQRFFGVPFPVWYRLDESGAPDYASPLVADEADLPVDPTTDVPSGFDESQRGKPGGFMADPDVMDTWATSSLTPQIAGGWEDDPDLFSRVFPMDLRPQAHDIIRTWLFATVVRSHLEFDSLPWSDAAISGWILDPDRKKMSKSKGNVVTPMGLLEQYGSDAVRYWSASGRPGTDTAFNEGQMKIGRKLAIKILNASRFVLEAGDAPAAGAASDAEVSEPVDLAVLASLRALVADVTVAFEGYDYARALERTEAFFWTFCDDYLELVKNRAYGSLGDDRALSARVALRTCLSVLLRLFAPILPFVTEEVWSWWQEGSIHVSAWPGEGEIPAGGDPAVFESASVVLGEVRRAKTEAGVSLRAPVASAVVRAGDDLAGLVSSVADDLRQAGVIEDLRVEPVAGDGSGAGPDALEVEIRLA